MQNNFEIKEITILPYKDIVVIIYQIILVKYPFTSDGAIHSYHTLPCLHEQSKV